MAAATAIPFHVVICLKHSGRHQPWSTPIDNVLEYDNEEELVDRLYHDLAEDRRETNILLHSAQGCGNAINLTGMRKDFRSPHVPLYSGRPYILMHLESVTTNIDTALPPFQSNSLPRRSGIASQTAIQHSVAALGGAFTNKLDVKVGAGSINEIDGAIAMDDTQHKSPASGKKVLQPAHSVHMVSVSEKPKKQRRLSDSRAIRIGTYDNTKPQEDWAIPKERVVVARMDESGTSVAEFTVVDAWIFNCVQIGCVWQGSKIEKFDRKKSIRMDHDFASASCETEELLGYCLPTIAQKRQGASVVVDIDGRSAVIKALSLPLWPNSVSDPPPPARNNSKDKEIQSIVTFINDFDGGAEEDNLRLPIWTQAELEWQDSCASFKSYVLDDPEVAKSTGTIRQHLDKVFGPRWTITIWVMAQDCDSTNLYSWDASPRRLARDWVNEALEAKLGRKLYIEVWIHREAVEDKRLPKGLPSCGYPDNAEWQPSEKQAVGLTRDRSSGSDSDKAMYEVDDMEEDGGVTLQNTLLPEPATPATRLKQITISSPGRPSHGNDHLPAPVNRMQARRAHAGESGFGHLGRHEPPRLTAGAPRLPYMRVSDGADDSQVLSRNSGLPAHGAESSQMLYRHPDVGSPSMGQGGLASGTRAFAAPPPSLNMSRYTATNSVGWFGLPISTFENERLGLDDPFELGSSSRNPRLRPHPPLNAGLVGGEVEEDIDDDIEKRLAGRADVRASRSRLGPMGASVNQLASVLSSVLRGVGTSRGDHEDDDGAVKAGENEVDAQAEQPAFPSPVKRSVKVEPQPEDGRDDQASTQLTPEARRTLRNRNKRRRRSKAKAQRVETAENTSRFCAVIMIDQQRAEKYLQLADGDLTQAVELYFNKPDL